MMDDKSLLNELLNKKVMVKTHGGVGTKDISLALGEYKGIILGFDGQFLKLKYEIKKFAQGKNVITTDIIYMNVAYIVTVNEYVEKED
jgi:hypothetical protein